MSQRTQPRNLAARMARWSGRHRKVAVLGWLGLMGAALRIRHRLPDEDDRLETSGPGESGRVNEILYEEFERPAGERVLVQSTQFEAESAQFRAVVQAVVDATSSLDEVATVQSPSAPAMTDSCRRTGQRLSCWSSSPGHPRMLPTRPVLSCRRCRRPGGPP